LFTEAIVRLGIAQSPEGRLIFSADDGARKLEMGAFSRRDSLGIKSDTEKVLNLFPRLRELIKRGDSQAQHAGDLCAFDATPLTIIRWRVCGLATMLVTCIF